MAGSLEDFVIRFPSAEDQERERAFTVNKNYVSSIALYLEEAYGGPSELVQRLVEAQRGLAGYRRLRRRDGDQDAIARYLRIAWASELQLRLGSLGDPTTLRYSNVWAPVHCYYAVYMSLQALFTANGMEGLADDHTSSLRTISNIIKSRDLFPLPWNVTCTGCCQLGDARWEGLPDGAVPDGPFEVLSRPTMEMFWPRYCKMLETTRSRRLERNFKEWKKSRGRKAIRGDEKRAVAANLLPTTIFDFFWRLRVRSNYRDVSSFLTWSVTDGDHRDFHSSLVTVADATCVLVQSLLIPTVGQEAFEQASAEFMEDIEPTLVGFLDSRRATLL